MPLVLWLISSLYLTIISIFLFKPTTPFSGGQYYIVFYLLYIIGVQWLYNKKEKIDFNIPSWAFILGCLIILFGHPLFENDHYRYLWEGKVFLLGKNPYLYAPVSEYLVNIEYAVKDRIAFSHLTTVYPPLALTWFGLAGLFSFPLSLKIMMIFNSVVAFLFFRILKNRVNAKYLVLLIPYIQKEFIQGVHIDFFASFFFLLFLVDKLKFKNLYLSYWTKFLTILIFPFEILKLRLSKKEIFIRISLTFILPVLILWATDFSLLSGFKTFSGRWVWSPGFYTIVDKFFEASIARIITLGCFAMVYLLTWLWAISKFKQNKFTYKLNLVCCYLIFSSLMFFSPVYNGWYAIWFIIPALLLDLKWGVYYGLMSIFCYVSYIDQSLLLAGEICAHIFFPLSLYEIKQKLKFIQTQNEDLATT